MEAILVDTIIKKVFAIVLVIAFVADTIFIYYINKHGIVLSNTYYSFHRKMGLIKITILKISMILWIIYTLIFEPSGKSGSIFTIITAYFILAIKLFTDYRKSKIEQH